jgi:antitoxin VapB
MTLSAKVFQNGRSQAVSLPKECRVDTDEVYIEKIGHSLMITPKPRSKWDVMRNALHEMEEMEDFELERNQPKVQTRELF